MFRERMTSYAQNFEDVLLRRLFPERRDGYYIDVGAASPVCHSVTKYFYDRGWRGINVEPIPSSFDELRRHRPRDVNLNIGLSDRVGRLTFYEAPNSNCWSARREMLSEMYGTPDAEIVARDVAVSTLAALCAAHVDVEIDFLKIDVEDHESQVIAGADWDRWRPRAVVVEGGNERWGPTLEAARYHHATFDGVNHYYVRREDRELIPRLEYPVNVVDNFVLHEYAEPIAGLTHLLAEARAELEASRAEATALRSRLDAPDALGPTARALALGFQRTARRHRRVASLLRPFFAKRSRPAGVGSKLGG